LPKNDHVKRILFFFIERSVELTKIGPFFTNFCFVILGLIVELERNASSSNKLIDDMKKKHKITDPEDKNQKLIAKLEKKNQNLDNQNKSLENELEEMNLSLIAELERNEKITSNLKEVKQLQNDLFQISVKKGQTEVFQRIFVNQEIKNPKDQNGVTLLHQAAENGYESICQLIVDNTEDSNPKDIIGKIKS
jgi:ankyrin repeat protein